jgi:hypothetical protein
MQRLRACRMKSEASKALGLAFWTNNAVLSNVPHFEPKCIHASWRVGKCPSFHLLFETSLSHMKIKFSVAFWHFQIGWNNTEDAFLLFYLFFDGIGFELRASRLLDRTFTTWATLPPPFFVLGISGRVSFFSQGLPWTTIFWPMPLV